MKIIHSFKRNRWKRKTKRCYRIYFSCCFTAIEWLLLSFLFKPPHSNEPFNLINVKFPIYNNNNNNNNSSNSNSKQKSWEKKQKNFKLEDNKSQNNPPVVFEQALLSFLSAIHKGFRIPNPTCIQATPRRTRERVTETERVGKMVE